MIQTYQTHQLGGSQPWTKANIGNFSYNFNGQVLIDKKIQQKDNAPTIEDKTENEYDHVGRLTKVFHGINGNRYEVVRLTYDQVGRLKQKKFRADENFLIGGTLDYINRPPIPNANIDDIARKAIFLNLGTVIDAKSINKYSATINPNAPQGVSISGLQTMDFSHHIRGGLRGINLDVSGNPTPNATEGDLFSYKLDYETAGFYDGNIGKQSWQGVNDQNQAIGLRSYTYGYDKSSRLLSGIYAGINGENYTLSGLSYDKNGNIKTMQRNGKTSSGFGLMDNLNYVYDGNKLNNVTDGVSATDNEVDLVPRGSGNYTYYTDGSVKSDANEGISLIIYDTFLKQPKEIQLTDGRKINHYYNGAGALLKTVYSTGEYWEFTPNGMIYKNGQPYQMAVPEGRAVYTGGAWQYEFFYTDHLGNTRVAFRANGNQLVKTSETAFDPWGVVLRGAGQVNAYQNRFEFQNKEKESTFGLNRINLGARTYNATIGRLDRVDPLAEKMRGYSVYNYVFNNPLRFIDPDGMAPFDDYLIRGNGQIIVKNTKNDNFDRFFTEIGQRKVGTMVIRYYHLEAQLDKNESGLVRFPDSGIGYTSYGEAEKGGLSTGVKKGVAFEENVGSDDSYLKPKTAAALFGVINETSGKGITLSLGDMSSSNGSDPAIAGNGTFHHAGHGHMGKRIGLDADFRYVGNDGQSFRGVMNSKKFNLEYNTAVYEASFRFGFDSKNTYQGKTGSIAGVKTMGGHDNHGHLGFKRNATIFFNYKPYKQ